MSNIREQKGTSPMIGTIKIKQKKKKLFLRFCYILF